MCPTIPEAGGEGARLKLTWLASSTWGLWGVLAYGRLEGLLLAVAGGVIRSVFHQRSHGAVCDPEGNHLDVCQLGRVRDWERYL